MKKYRIRIEYLIDDKYEDLADYLQRNNITAENEFFENSEQICLECGEELEDGKCFRCSQQKQNTADIQIAISEIGKSIIKINTIILSMKDRIINLENGNKTDKTKKV